MDVCLPHPSGLLLGGYFLEEKGLRWALRDRACWLATLSLLV